MGASSSSSSSSQSQQQQEEESSAASTGSLPLLKSSFSILSNPNSNSLPLSSLEKKFSLHLPTLSSESPPIPQHFPRLLADLGPSVTSLLFPSSGGAIGWVDFLRGYNRCCARTPAASSLTLLCRLYSEACRRAEIPSNLEFFHDPDSGDGDDGKVGGCFAPSDVLMLLWMCWIMARDWRVSKISNSKGGGDGENLVLPDFTHLVVSSLVSCGEFGDDDRVWDCDVFGIATSVPAQRFHMWVLSTVPGLANCFSEYVQEKLRVCAAEGDSILSAGDASSGDVQKRFLLTSGRAWAISLTLRNKLYEELPGASFPGLVNETLDNILYRSTIHGKGLNRFWSNIEGYHGPLLILISANSADSSQTESRARRWVIGILTDQGFENRDTFYGNSGYLYAISPVFCVLSPLGREKNFVYSHLHPTGRVYEPNPKPVGLAFGGTLGNERIFIDEDFAKVEIRHHAVDKTYQHGSLIPNQGFLPIEASLLEVEVWGFGGKRAQEQQGAYKKRESLFSEQRRKVDLKTFGNWEDSPEKMMMDMVSDPNQVRREDR